MTKDKLSADEVRKRMQGFAGKLFDKVGAEGAVSQWVYKKGTKVIELDTALELISRIAPPPSKSEGMCEVLKKMETNVKLSKDDKEFLRSLNKHPASKSVESAENEILDLIREYVVPGKKSMGKLRAILQSIAPDYGSKVRELLDEIKAPCDCIGGAGTEMTREWCDNCQAKRDILAILTKHDEGGSDERTRP